MWSGASDLSGHTFTHQISRAFAAACNWNKAYAKNAVQANKGAVALATGPPACHLPSSSLLEHCITRSHTHIAILKAWLLVGRHRWKKVLNNACFYLITGDRLCNARAVLGPVVKFATLEASPAHPGGQRSLLHGFGCISCLSQPPDESSGSTQLDESSDSTQVDQRCCHIMGGTPALAA